MRYLLYLPGIILMLLPILTARRRAIAAEQARREQEAERAAIAEQRRQAAERKQAIQAAKAAEREAARAAREAEQQRKQAARLEAARQRAEYAERELAAKREMKALERAQIIPDAEPDTEPTAPDNKPTAPDARPKFKGNNAFAGQVVAFTGRLPGMTRREAIQAVQDNGGRAYTKMPAGTTLLVVGDKPGMCKMDKADEWIGQVRKITAAQFFAMLEEPLTLELEEFAAMFAA